MDQVDPTILKMTVTVSQQGSRLQQLPEHQRLGTGLS